MDKAKAYKVNLDKLKERVQRVVDGFKGVTLDDFSLNFDLHGGYMLCFSFVYKGCKCSSCYEQIEQILKNLDEKEVELFLMFIANFISRIPSQMPIR